MKAFAKNSKLFLCLCIGLFIQEIFSSETDPCIALIKKPQPQPYTLSLYEPWFTGPMLTPNPVNLEPGKVAIDWSLTLFDTYALYTSDWKTQSIDSIWSINPLIDVLFGITRNTGLELQIPFITNKQRGKMFSHFQDINVLFGYQLLHDTRDSWIPDLRIDIQGTLPTGRYQKLTSSQQAIQITGLGSFQIGPVVAACKKIYFQNSALAVGGGITYLIPLSVHVEGFNAYGGGYKTNGTVHPGQNVSAIFSAEYSFFQHWVVVFEAEYFIRGSCRFQGKKGTSLLGTEAQTGLPPFIQYSIAPELEYVFAENSGMLAGLWFTVAGKNSPAFGSFFLAYSHLF